MSGFKLKINIGSKAGSHSSPPTPAPTIPTPTAATPGGSRPKLKLTNNSTPPTPAPVEEVLKPKKTKAGRVPKVSAKLAESKKRTKEESEDEDDGSTIQVQQPVAKKFKVSFSKNAASQSAPRQSIMLKAKTNRQMPARMAGEGYDSEASDRELDPVIEEQFVLRMLPGDDCDYVRQAIVNKKIGVSKAMGGADVYMKFFSPNGRRAAITVRGNVYAAVLVDLPCIIEGMKSWDKRGWWKSADICQMLWVFRKIKDEEEATTIAIPSIVDPNTYQYPHGLTPPMHFVRKRRFRKRISRTAIEAVEAAVDKLLKADMEATSTRYETFGDKRVEAESEGFSEDVDAEGEDDDIGSYFPTQHHRVEGNVDHEADQMAADLEAELEAEMQEESLAATPMSLAATPMSMATPMMNGDATPGGPEVEDSGDESMEQDGDGNDEAGDPEADENEKVRLAVQQGIYDDIAELEASLAEAQNKLVGHTNAILRRRVEDSIRKIKAELQLKKESIEDGRRDDEDDDDDD